MRVGTKSAGIQIGTTFQGRCVGGILLFFVDQRWKYKSKSKLDCSNDLNSIIRNSCPHLVHDRSLEDSRASWSHFLFLTPCKCNLRHQSILRVILRKKVANAHYPIKRAATAPRTTRSVGLRLETLLCINNGELPTRLPNVLDALCKSAK
jgi:hypothetical protein